MTDVGSASTRELAYAILALFAPGSNHTTIGLLLLLFGKILCPLAAMAIGLRLLGRGARLEGWILLAAGLGLLALGLATRQPYAV